MLIYNHKSLLETKKSLQNGHIPRKDGHSEWREIVRPEFETSGPALENNGFCHPIVNLKSRNTMHSGK
jgi:hypothetical protein